MQRAGKKKKNASTYTKKEVESIIRKVEENAIKEARKMTERIKEDRLKDAMQVAEATREIMLTALFYTLAEPPFNFSKAKLEKVLIWLNRYTVQISTEDSETISEMKQEIRIDTGFDTEKMNYFNMFETGRYVGPERMKRAFGKDWDKEFDLNTKKKMHEAWGNYEVK